MAKAVSKTNAMRILEREKVPYKEMCIRDSGFDVQDIRLGGLAARVKSCMERLQALYDGSITVIEELEEMPLDIYGNGEEYGHVPIVYNSWGQTVTANVL